MKIIHHCFQFMVVLCALAPATSRAQAEVTGIYLTWRDDPATAITVNWLSLYPDAPQTVWYRRDDAAWASREGVSKLVPPVDSIGHQARARGGCTPATVSGHQSSA